MGLLQFVKTEAVYEWYDDDGYTKNMDLEQGITTIKVKADSSIDVAGVRQCECRLI